MHQRALVSGGWARGGSSEVVRRACPASGAQWNVQVVRGKVNGKCLWNACKALSLGLLLMVLGAAMATIGYYADHLSMAHEVRGNHTVRVKNESRGFHLNNLSYAGPIVMGVGGFIVVAACVMTFEARDSAAKVVPARLKLSTNGGPSTGCYSSAIHPSSHGPFLNTAFQAGYHLHHHHHQRADRRALTESFMHFSKSISKNQRTSRLKVAPQGFNRSPSAPNLVPMGSLEQSSPTAPQCDKSKTGKRQTFANCALLNAGILHRHALSVDESTANYRLSCESLHQANGSQGSLALDLHLEYPVTLRIHDRRRNPLIRQRRVDELEEQAAGASSRRSSCKGSIQNNNDTKIGYGGSAHHISRRYSNASDLRQGKKHHHHDHPREKLERALSYDARLLNSPTPSRSRRLKPPNNKQEPAGSSSDTDIRNVYPVVTHFQKYRR